MKEIKNIHHYKKDLGYNDSFYIFNVSDVHFDSRKCDRKLLKKHFDYAKSVDGKIIINGDFLDVMGMKRDPRSIPNEIRPEYMIPEASYLDLVIEDAYQFLKPYKDNILLLNYGNHETNIIKRQQTDPLKRIWQLLDSDKIKLGAYKSALILNFKMGKTGSCSSSKWYLHHGSGGNAKRSKGLLSADILVSQNPWADVISCGHDHQKWHLPYEVLDLNNSNTDWTNKRIDILRTGSYKKKSVDFGWEVEKGFNQPTLGGYTIRYYWEKVNQKNTLRKQVIELN